MNRAKEQISVNEWAAHDEYDEYAFIFGINTHNGQVNKCRIKQKKGKKRKELFNIGKRYNKKIYYTYKHCMRSTSVRNFCFVLFYCWIFHWIVFKSNSKTDLPKSIYVGIIIFYVHNMLAIVRRTRTCLFSPYLQSNNLALY